MNDYQPKVGDRVMVGERGPCRVTWIDSARKTADLRTIPDGKHVANDVAFEWLTPAPEPEPDEPTAYGALVRDGDGRLWIHNPVEYAQTSPEWDAEDRLSTGWANIPRPITVVLADPAEVEALRAERDELRQRIDQTVEFVERGVYSQNTLLRHLWGNS